MKEISIKMHVYVEVEDREMTQKEINEKVDEIYTAIEKLGVSCQIHEYEVQKF